MRVYVIRHGQSENNIEHKWTGWLDAPLTEQGREDAKKAGAILRGIPFEKIYTSDLSRAMETAAIAVPDFTYETTPLLREINVGSLAGTPTGDTSEETLQNVAQFGYAAVGGESREEFSGRVKQMMRKLETSGYQNVALFCHAGWVKEMLYTVLDTRIVSKHIVCKNCTVAVFEYENDNWSLHSWINLA